MTTLRHIVLFRVHEEVGEDDVASAVAMLRGLSNLPEVSSWRVERSLDGRKGRIIVEDATFASPEDFERFRDHPDHIAAGERMAEISDWWNGDYML